MNERDIQNWKKRLTGFGVVVAIIAIVLVLGVASAAETVDEGNVKVLKDKGAVTGDVLEPGWHLKTPLVESTVSVPTRPQTYTLSGNPWEGETDNVDSVSVMSNDQQQVNADITVRYHIPSAEAPYFHSEWNNLAQAEERVIRPTVQEVAQQRLSSMNATEANSEEGREALGDDIEAQLKNETGQEIVIEAAQVRDIHLDPSYTSELEQVEVKREQANQARIEAEGDADAERIRAEGDADAMEIRNEQITEEILALEQIKAYDDGTVYVVDPNSNTILEMNPNQTDGAVNRDQVNSTED